MISQTVDLYDRFHLPHSGEGGKLQLYVPEFSVEVSKRSRPAILIMPGGGYEYLSAREGEPVALRFLARGFAAFVLTYSCNTKYPVPLIEAALAMAYIRKNAEEFRVDPAHVCALGFSAGGHLCATLATLFAEQPVKDALGSDAPLARPDAVLLSYPVITSEATYTHAGTLNIIFGGKMTAPGSYRFTGTDPSLYEALSLEKRVTKDSPPAFLWHTFEDDCVPVENSLLYAGACKRNGVPFELHVFEKGGHGLSLANGETEHVKTPPEVARLGMWTELACDFLAARGFVIRME